MDLDFTFSKRKRFFCFFIVSWSHFVVELQMIGMDCLR